MSLFLADILKECSTFCEDMETVTVRCRDEHKSLACDFMESAEKENKYKRCPKDGKAYFMP